jgi:enoyl-CoA hydratase/carnithine racemase
VWHGSPGLTMGEPEHVEPHAATSASERSWRTLTLTRDGGVAEVRLTRTDARNAIMPTMMQELIDVAGVLNASEDVRAVVLSGEGPSFCAGIDLGVMTSLGDDRDVDPTPPSYQLAALGQRMISALRMMRPITVTAVHGHAVGGGLLLMMVGDLRIIADDCQCWLPEADFGTPLPWGGLPQLVAEVGPVVARELVLTCRRFSGTEAVRMGLANRAVAASDVQFEAMQFARRIARTPVAAADLTKRHVRAVMDSMGATTAFADAYAIEGVMQFSGSRQASGHAAVDPRDRS